jgi:uncharacterized protein YlxP (DUF503 family)
MAPSAYVALLTIHLHFPEAGSLKAKRKDLSSVKAQLQGRLGLSVAEVDHHDVWQRATLAGAMVSGSLATLTASCDRVSKFLDSRFPDGVRVERTLASFEDVEGLA